MFTGVLTDDEVKGGVAGGLELWSKVPRGFGLASLILVVLSKGSPDGIRDSERRLLAVYPDGRRLLFRFLLPVRTVPGLAVTWPAGVVRTPCSIQH